MRTPRKQPILKYHTFFVYVKRIKTHFFYSVLSWLQILNNSCSLLLIVTYMARRTWPSHASSCEALIWMFHLSGVSRHWVHLPSSPLGVEEGAVLMDCQSKIVYNEYKVANTILLYMKLFFRNQEPFQSFDLVQFKEVSST